MILADGYTYFWCGHSDVYHAQGVAVAVSIKQSPMIIEVTPVNERIVRLMIRHFSCVTSLVSEYTPTEASDLTVKEAFYTTFESVFDLCPGEILFSSWGISMHRLALIGMVMRYMLVPCLPEFYQCNPEELWV